MKSNRNPISEDDLQFLANLPSEIILEILLKLPLKSLSKFRYVCKSWFNGITHPHFAKSHLTISLQRKISPCVLISNRRNFALLDHQDFDNRQISITASKVELKEFDETFPGYNFGLVGSSNGLLCFCTQFRVIPSRRDFAINDIYICNPITQEHVVVPRSTTKYRHTHNICRGFGFDLSTGEYKVIRIYSYCIIRGNVKEYSSEGEIYTLGSGKWREMSNVPYYNESCEVGVFANGCLHWLALKIENMKVMQQLVISKFDVESEQLSFIQVPSVVIKSLRNMKYFGVIDEEICIMKSNFGEMYEIWVVNGDSWSKKFVIGKYMFENPCIGCYEVRKSKSGEFLLWAYNLDHRSRSMRISPFSNPDGYIPPCDLTYYEPGRRTVQHITVQSDSIFWEPIVFLGSLLSPKSIEMSTTRPRLG